MKKKFIVIVDNATVEQQNAVTNLYNESEGISCWHHFPHLWLLTDESGARNAGTIRDEVAKVVGGSTQLMVFDIPSGSGATMSCYMQVQFFPWLQDNWYTKP